MKLLLIAILTTLFTQVSFSQSDVELVYNGRNENISEAVKKANEILNNGSFYDEIRKIQKFDNSKLTGQEIGERIEKANQQIKIVRRIKPIANASTKRSDKIKISRSKFGKDSSGKFNLSTAVNTLIHETVHAVDFLNKGNEFTHNGNKPAGQKNTAPWIIGAIAENMVPGTNS